MSMYELFIKDFVVRTNRNLEYIEEKKENGDEVYEVTQLVNSFLGLIVFPKEKAGEQIRRISDIQTIIDDIEFEVRRNTYSYKRRDINLKNFLYHIRNAIAHGGVEFFHDESNEIHSISFYDYIRNKRGTIRENFYIVMDISQIREFVKLFSEKFIETYNN